MGHMLLLDRGSTLRALVYHRITERGPEDDALTHPAGCVSPALFEKQLEHLARFYSPVSADELLAALAGRHQLPRRAVLVTFDDGYRDFQGVAWPILKRYGIPAVLFVPTAFPGDPERVFWWDALWQMLARTRRDRVVAGFTIVLPTSAEDRVVTHGTLSSWLKALTPSARAAALRELEQQLGVRPEPTRAVLSWKELRLLSNDGVTVAAHSRTHELLDQISDRALAEEIEGSRDDLVRELGSCPPLFAYPNGNLDRRTLDALRAARFVAGFTVAHGVNHLGSADPRLLRRDQGDVSMFRFGLHLLGPIAVMRARRHPFPSRS